MRSLLRALARLPVQRPTLAIAGDGPLRGSLEALAAQLRIDPPIRFLGLRTDVPDLLRAADGLVLSSAWEGSPNVVLEAMAAAVPVVATQVGGVPGSLRSGETGWVVPAHDSRRVGQVMPPALLMITLRPGGTTDSSARGHETSWNANTRSTRCARAGLPLSSAARREAVGITRGAAHSDEAHGPE